MVVCVRAESHGHLVVVDECPAVQRTNASLHTAANHRSAVLPEIVDTQSHAKPALPVRSSPAYSPPACMRSISRVVFSLSRLSSAHTPPHEANTTFNEHDRKEKYRREHHHETEQKALRVLGGRYQRFLQLGKVVLE